MLMPMLKLSLIQPQLLFIIMVSPEILFILEARNPGLDWSESLPNIRGAQAAEGNCGAFYPVPSLLILCGLVPPSPCKDRALLFPHVTG